MGYAGGSSERPTYRSMGDHTECFQVDFDPAAVSYDDLLDMFWTSHDPTRAAWKPQYASLVLAHDAEQLSQARASAERMAEIVGRPMATRIDLVGDFWLAEGYHQKYYLQNDRTLNSEFRNVYPDLNDFVNSTAAARVNGYLYGAAGCLRLEEELPLLGLSEAAADHLRTGCHG